MELPAIEFSKIWWASRNECEFERKETNTL